MAKKRSSKPTAPAKSGVKDYVGIALEYAREAVADKERKTHGLWIQRAAKRFLDDVERAKRKDSPFIFRPEYAEAYCMFIERLPHVEGRWETPTIVLVPAQIFFLVQLFGFRLPDDSGRRFTTALYAVARKNAKTTLAAAIILACLCLEDELGPQALSAATTGSQARLMWNVAKRMVEASPELSLRFSISVRANDIRVNFGNRGGIFKPINAKASTQDGLNPAYTNLDELHAHKTSDLLNVLMSAAGARSNPLWLYTTTEGYETPGPWPEQRDFAEKVLEGTVEADHYLAVFFRVDDDDDDFDESKWIKANPLMVSNNILLTSTRKLAIEAKAMPGNLSEFRIKRLNRRAAVAGGWVDLIKWNDGKIRFDEKMFDSLEGRPCWAALDLASTLDMNAWRLLWQLEDDTFVTWGRYWTPAKSVKNRTVRNTVPYQAWAHSGWLTVTDGEVTDYDVIKQDILDDYKRFNPNDIGFDPWNATQLSNELVNKGLPMVQFVQGTKSYNPAMKAFERAYTSGELKHEGSPILLWNMSNVLVRYDINKNMAPDRKNAKEKIDGAAALFMAFGLAAAELDNYVSATGSAMM